MISYEVSFIKYKFCILPGVNGPARLDSPVQETSQEISKQTVSYSTARSGDSWQQLLLARYKHNGGKPAMYVCEDGRRLKRTRATEHTYISLSTSYLIKHDFSVE